MLSTAVIQSRIRRVIVTSLLRLRPVVWDQWWFGAAAAAYGYRAAPSPAATTARWGPLGMIGSPAKLDEN
jgi:hypothetical protein